MKQILFNDHFQNFKIYGIQKAQLINADIPNNLGARRIIPIISKQAGTKHIIIAGLPTFFNSDTLSDNPALARIIINAILRNCADISRIDVSIKFSAYGPIIIPTANIPISDGNRSFLHIPPSNRPNNKMIAKLKNINIPP